MIKRLFIGTFFVVFGFGFTKFGKNIYVHGRVYNPVSGEGIAGVDVKLYRNKLDSSDPLGSDSKRLKVVTTDENGYYQVEYLASPFIRAFVQVNDAGYYPIGWVGNGSTGSAGIKKGKKNHMDFEAMNCDPQTYEHIKMQTSVDDNHLDDNYLVHTRNFILDEVEADVVYLQNKIIGKNHLQWAPNYRYKAWYKAYRDIVIGNHVTPKTNAGDYTIEKTGEITVFACHEVNIKPGFSSEAGSKFHAYIHCDGCSRPRESSGIATSNSNSGQTQSEQVDLQDLETYEQDKVSFKLQVYPNPTSGGVTILFPETKGKFVLVDANGRLIEGSAVDESNQKLYLNLNKGIYFLRWYNENQVLTEKISVL